MIQQLILAVKAKKGDKIHLMINGAGATTQMEMFIVFRRAKKFAEDMKIKVAHSLVGEYLTVQEMGGFQMFVAKVDKELIKLLNAPSDAPYWTA
jgi:dihydroxyacetone kinase-like protein